MNLWKFSWNFSRSWWEPFDILVQTLQDFDGNPSKSWCGTKTIVAMIIFVNTSQPVSSLVLERTENDSCALHWWLAYWHPYKPSGPSQVALHLFLLREQVTTLWQIHSMTWLLSLCFSASGTTRLGQVSYGSIFDGSFRSFTVLGEAAGCHSKGAAFH